MIMRRLVLPLVLFAGLCGLSCEWLSVRNYNVDKPSPDGTYRVKVKAWVKDEGWGSFTEQVKVQFIKGQEVVEVREWERKDTWESTFIGDFPVIEWICDNVLRMGRKRTDQPFMDEVIVSNNSGEHLKYVDVNYVRFESFKIFDVAPGSEITLRASPAFQPERLSDRYDSYIIYSGTTQGGKKFIGFIENKQGRFPADGQLKFHITITPKDLKAATKDER